MRSLVESRFRFRAWGLGFGEIWGWREESTKYLCSMVKHGSGLYFYVYCYCYCYCYCTHSATLPLYHYYYDYY